MVLNTELNSVPLVQVGEGSEKGLDVGVGHRAVLLVCKLKWVQ